MLTHYMLVNDDNEHHFFKTRSGMENQTLSNRKTQTPRLPEINCFCHIS